MPVPKKKTSKSRQGKRRSHLRLRPPALDICPHCHNAKLAHHVCPNCGWYKDREVVEIKSTKK